MDVERMDRATESGPGEHGGPGGRRPGAPFDPEPWRGELTGFARRMGARDPEDVVQETFLRAVQKPPATAPRAWLHRVALNVMRDRGRAASRRGERAELADAAALPAGGPSPLRAALEGDLVRRAWGVVRRLPDQQRAALILRIQRHMDYDEVATACECSVATARQHFHLAVKAVRNALAEERDG
jgi:RNA polymerase sigma-70 factor (ECF subfamily)